MRVVGGPSDGIDIWIGEGKTHINLPDPLPVFAVEDDDGPFVPPPNILQTWTVYSVRLLRTPRSPARMAAERGGYQIIDPDHEDLKYLAPADWSDMKAIKWQFTK